MAKHSRRDVVVTLSGDRDAAEVTRDLEAAGFLVNEVLGAIGVVTGLADDKTVTKMRKVRGVADVSDDYPVDIGPPGSPIS
jgi:hypothetical protein